MFGWCLTTALYALFTFYKRGKTKINSNANEYEPTMLLTLFPCVSVLGGGANAFSFPFVIEAYEALVCLQIRKTTALKLEEFEISMQTKAKRRLNRCGLCEWMKKKTQRQNHKAMSCGQNILWFHLSFQSIDNKKNTTVSIHYDAFIFFRRWPFFLSFSRIFGSMSKYSNS